MFTRNFHRAGRAIGHGEAGRLVLSCVAVAALVLAACEHSGGGAINPDLNRQLIGRFFGAFTAEVGTSTDEYICDGYNIARNTQFNDDPTGSWAGTIEHVYNFNAASTAGCLIVKYRTFEGEPYAGMYDALYFSYVSDKSVWWGNAWTVEDWKIPTAVGTLNEAIEKFKPENATLYGGTSAQVGDALLRQP
jgi:hypothetical protein